VRKKIIGRSTCGGIYGVGFVGALVYFLQNASGLTESFVGLLKVIL